MVYVQGRANYRVGVGLLQRLGLLARPEQPPVYPRGNMTENALILFKEYGKKAIPLEQLTEAVGQWLTSSAEIRNQLDFAIKFVFSYWVAKTGRRPRSCLLSDDRRTITRKRIVEQGEDEMQELLSPLLWAIDGCMASDYHVEHGYTQLELILRDRGKLEGFAERMPGFRRGDLHPLVKGELENG